MVAKLFSLSVSSALLAVSTACLMLLPASAGTSAFIQVWLGEDKQEVNVDECPMGCWILQKQRGGKSASDKIKTYSSTTALDVNSRRADAGERICKSHVSRAFLVCKNKISDQFADEITDALRTIPQSCLDALTRADYHVLLAPTISAALPAINNKQVRGYEPSVTWSSIYGLFNRPQKCLVLAETAQQHCGDKFSLQPLNNKQRRVGIVRHEFGHAVDQYLGNYSHTEEFSRLYKHDAELLNDGQRQALYYFLQSGDSGQEETFAELFACVGDRGCDHSQDKMLVECFGDLMPLIQKKLAAM